MQEKPTSHPLEHSLAPETLSYFPETDAPVFPIEDAGESRGGAGRASLATFALLNAMLIAGPAQAQTPAAQPGRTGSPGNAPAVAVTDVNTVTEMPEVVVRGQQEGAPYRSGTVSRAQFTEPLVDTPQTVTVIPRAVIEEQGATTLRDVLRNVPGISIQAGEGGVPAGDNLSIRGFNARTDTFIDGVRDIGGYTRDPFNIEQVEVIKGPASSYTGRGSTGGSINLVTKAPLSEPFYAGTMGFGTDDYLRGTIDLNQPIASSPIPGTAVRFNALWTDADSPGRDEVQGRRWGIAPSVAFGLGTSTQLTLTYMHMDQENVPDYGIPWVPPTNVPMAKYANKPAPVDFGNYYGLINRDYEKTRTDVATLRLDHAFNDDLRLRFVSRYGRNERDSLITAPRFASTDSTLINRQLQSRDQTETIFANVLDVTAGFKTWGLEHTLVTGLEYAYETSKNYLRAGPDAPLADLFNPDPRDSYVGYITRTGAVNDAITNTLALYAFDTIKLNEQWQISGGLRWDYFGVNYDSRAVDGVLTSIDQEDKMLSYRAGIVYKPLPNGSIYATYGTSFNPSAEGLTVNTDNASLEPEESRTVEIGTKWDLFDHRISLTAAAFYTEKTNARTPAVGIDDPPNVLEGEQRVAGFEFGVAGSITEKWQVFGGYTYLDSEIEKSNNPIELNNDLPNAPRNSFTLWTTYELPWNFQIGAGAQFVDSRFTNADNLREAPSYWTFDAMLSYKINENISARINVYNLADEEYIDRVGGGHFIPGQGRWGMLTFSFRY